MPPPFPRDGGLGKPEVGSVLGFNTNISVVGDRALDNGDNGAPCCPYASTKKGAWLCYAIEVPVLQNRCDQRTTLAALTVKIVATARTLSPAATRSVTLSRRSNE